MSERTERRVDLHTHTTASDGTLTPGELVSLARDTGLGAVAITDHDSVAGLEEGLAAGEALGVRVIPGVEISSSEEGCEIHIVGLFLRRDCGELLDFLAERKKERVRRNQRLLDRLREIGMPLSPEEITPGAGGLLTRTHVAEAMARRGWAATPVEALERYLIPGKPGWVEKNTPPPKVCAEIIHRAGGLAFLAHLDRIHKGDTAHSLSIARRVLTQAVQPPVGADGRSSGGGDGPSAVRGQRFSRGPKAQPAGHRPGRAFCSGKLGGEDRGFFAASPVKILHDRWKSFSCNPLYNSRFSCYNVPIAPVPWLRK